MMPGTGADPTLHERNGLQVQQPSHLALARKPRLGKVGSPTAPATPMHRVPRLAASALLLLSGCNAGHGNDGDPVEVSPPAASVASPVAVAPAPVPSPADIDPATAPAAAEPAPAPALVVTDTKACLASLKAHARAPRARETVSIFRMFNAYPPRPGAVLDAEDVDAVDVRRLRRVNISPDCLPSLPFTFEFYHHAEGSGTPTKAQPGDLYPIRALRLKTGSFLVLYAHRAIETADHGGDVVMVSAVMFNKDGRGSHHVPQISLYVSYESSLWMEDAQLDDEGLTITSTSIDPERRDRVGNVLRYTPAHGPELQRRYILKNGRFERQPISEDPGRPGIDWDPAAHISGYKAALTHP